eukprot:2346628-Pyramimonas_sp.AAC.1
MSPMRPPGPAVRGGSGVTLASSSADSEASIRTLPGQECSPEPPSGGLSGNVSGSILSGSASEDLSPQGDSGG